MQYKYVSAVWCGPCRILHPIIKKVEEERDINFEEIDADDPKNKDFMEKHQIYSIPTLMVLDDDGNELHRAIGYQPKDKLIANLGL